METTVKMEFLVCPDLQVNLAREDLKENEAPLVGMEIQVHLENVDLEAHLEVLLKFQTLIFEIYALEL